MIPLFRKQGYFVAETIIWLKMGAHNAPIVCNCVLSGWFYMTFSGEPALFGGMMTVSQQIDKLQPVADAHFLIYAFDVGFDGVDADIQRLTYDLV